MDCCTRKILIDDFGSTTENFDKQDFAKNLIRAIRALTPKMIGNEGQNVNGVLLLHTEFVTPL